MAVSKYLQIKQHLLDKIESGEWPEYSTVPSENALAAEFCVSRMTARRALQELAEQGIIVRNQGARSSVASIKSQSSMLAIRNIADEITERGHVHTAKLLKLSLISADQTVAANLGLEPGDDVFYSLVVHFENKVAIQIEQRYVNCTAVPEYLNQDFEQQTSHDYLSKIAPLTEAEHLVEAVAADIEICRYLMVKQGEPCLRVSRRTWSKRDNVSFAILTHPGKHYRLGSRLTF